MRDRIALLFFFFLSVIGLIFLPYKVYALDNAYETEREARKQANENHAWVLSEFQGTRNGPFYQYDSTSQYLYFSYSDDNCVDVYDTEGTFLYCIILPDQQNGSVGVRCNKEEVYISSKDNTVYILQGKTEVAQLSSDDAVEKGFDFFWFYENTPRIKVDFHHILTFDGDGNIIKQIETPRMVAQTIPKAERIQILFFIPLLALFAAGFSIFYSRKKSG